MLKISQRESKPSSLLLVCSRSGRLLHTQSYQRRAAAYLPIAHASYRSDETEICMRGQLSDRTVEELRSVEYAHFIMSMKGWTTTDS